MTARRLQRSCPVCNRPDANPLFEKQGLHLVRCTHCTMVFVNPVDEDWADGSRYDQLGTPFYLSPDKLQSDYNPVRFIRELALFRRFCPEGRVLDVGCSTGAFLHHLQRTAPGAYQVTGIDVSGPALDHAESQGVPVLRGSFLDPALPIADLDAITFWAVAEHLMEPRRFIERAIQLLRPGGLCFILVPNFHSLAVRVAGWKYRYIFPQHLNYFSPRTLHQLGDSLPGVRRVHASSLHFNPIVLVQDARSDGRFVPDEERARLLKTTTRYKNRPLLRPLRLAITAIERGLGAFNLADNIAVVLQREPTPVNAPARTPTRSEPRPGSSGTR